MNDKQQLAAMGEHVASMKLTIHGHGINSEEEASGGFLTRCLPCSSQQQQTPCMAKRIEELEAQVMVMAGLLRELRDGVEGEWCFPGNLDERIDAALSGKLPAPAVPEGWQLVPVELMALLGSMVDLHSRRGVVLTVEMESLAEMLAAAPSPDSAK